MNGKREGEGTFLYANGSKYEGGWKNNLKHGFVSIKSLFEKCKDYYSIFGFALIRENSHLKMENSLRDILRKIKYQRILHTTGIQDLQKISEELKQGYLQVSF